MPTNASTPKARAAPSPKKSVKKSRAKFGKAVISKSPKQKKNSAEQHITFIVNETAYRVIIADDTPIKVIATTGDTALKEIPQFKLVDIQTL